MYFIKYDLLKKRLRERSVTVRESLPYFIAFVVIMNLPSILPIGRYNLWDRISEILSTAAFVGGILYAYYKNGGASGNDFFRKYILIGWVACVRFFFVFILVANILIYLGLKTGLMSLSESGPYDITGVFLAEIILHQRIGRHIGDTKSNDSQQDVQVA